MTALVSPVDVPVVPRLWPDSTIVIAATGPSLVEGNDIEAVCRYKLEGRCHVVAVKDASPLVPADVLYACDARWWRARNPLFAGPKYSLEPEAAKFATVLRNTGTNGLETDPSGLRTGKNSGYQAINLAVHLGANRIVLLGYDMKGDRGDHFFGRHPYPYRQPFQDFLAVWPTIVDPLRNLGVEVLNATRDTALMVFPRVTLEQAFS